MDKIAVFVIYDRAIDEEVLAALRECGIQSYTRWHNATGVGTTGPHQGDQVWPALNNSFHYAIRLRKRQALPPMPWERLMPGLP